MLKRILTLSLLVLMGCSGKPPVKEEVTIKQISLEFVKKIHILGPDGEGSCSSVFVNYKNKIRHITAGHCCTGIMQYKNKTVKIKKAAPHYDLCELSHKMMPKRGMRVMYKNPEMGDKIYFAGFPKGHNFSISQGFITTGVYRFPVPFFHPLMQTNAYAYYGNSGGAAINTDGDFLGIVSTTSAPFAHGSFVPVETVTKFLDE